MECVANFEIKSDCSVVADDLVLSIAHPKDLYRARIQNIPRGDYTTPFLLSLHLYFETPSLEEAQDIADELLAECLNLIALTTGSSLKRHRIRQIADATKTEKNEMRSMLIWADAIEYENPQPSLTDDLMQSIELLLRAEIDSAIKRALKWYRLGVHESVTDDQFMCFWFAIEIIAQHQKSAQKVPDRCPRCRTPLYCEQCKEYPEHRPYPKQAIRDLLKSLDGDIDDETINILDKARNSLMHGSTLAEIESSIPELHEHIVDILGRILWKALIFQFQDVVGDRELRIALPSTYLRRKLTAKALVETVIPRGASGDLDLNSIGLKVELKSAPPQSALPTIIRMTPAQYERLGRLKFSEGDQQEFCGRIFDANKVSGDHIFCRVLSTDMRAIRDSLSKGETGLWQDLFREILENTNENEL